MNKRRPYGYWTDVDNIEKEARNFMNANLLDYFPGATELKKLGAAILARAIYRSYPGKFLAVKRRLGKDSKERKENGFWSVDRIEFEAQAVIQEHNLEAFPSQSYLKTLGKHDLVNAIFRHYPGKYNGLRRNLGENVSEIKIRNYYRDFNNVLAEIKTVLEDYNLEDIPSVKFLRSIGKSSLGLAITKYHGGMITFRKLFHEMTGRKSKTDRLEEFLESYIGEQNE